jgi:paraquat-inducible protein B
MSKKASKTLIGAFVIGAIALIVAGVVIFGSGKLFKKTVKFVMFFEGSVKGLQVGAPVMFRGVKIGEVTDIRLEVNAKDLSFWIPVYVEIDPGRMVSVGDGKKYGDYRYIRALIEKGLRSQLQLQSFVTGQLMINVDFFPDKPARFVGVDKKYREIPTVPTPLEELTKTIQDLKLEQTVRKLDSAIAGIDKIVNSPQLTESISSMNQALRSIERLARDVDAQMTPVAADIQEASVAARSAFAQAEKTLALKEGVPGEIASGIRDTLKAARLTLEETQRAVEAVRQITAQNSNIGYEINRSLEQMTAMSRSLRSLADYLDRHPEALIKGKTPPKGE